MGEHQKQWEFLIGKFEAEQLGHAYLLSGQDGIKKEEFAKEFIKYINCTQTKKPCQKCVTCRLIEKGFYPDLLTVTSAQSGSSIKNEKDMMEIDVAQVRQINSFLSYKSYYGNYKAVIIENAQRLNAEAQNSFLKTLEEPKGKTVIFLISSKPEVLLPTISSRCQTIPFFPFEDYKESPQEQVLLRQLLAIMPAELAVKFQYVKKANVDSSAASIIFEVLQRYFRNVLLIKIGAAEGMVAPEFSQYSIEKIKKIIRLIETLNAQITTSNANPKLALEILLLEL